MATRKTPTRSAAKPAAKSTATKRASTPRKPAAKAPAKRSAAKVPARRTGHSAGFASFGALAVAALGAVAFGAWRMLRRPTEGTEPTDLLGDAHPDGSERAIEAFRPDPTAPVPASERDQFRPALVQNGASS